MNTVTIKFGQGDNAWKEKNVVVQFLDERGYNMQPYEEIGVIHLTKVVNEEPVEFSDNVLDHRPNLENLKAIGKEDDYLFQALAYMGNASKFMSWANTVLELVEEVPEQLKQDIKKVHSGIYEMQEKLREYKKEDDK
ncbi:hypothetical protein V6E27_10940 [Bacillus cereus]|uniref:hypothetical protein n=1 Tax=Bacillus cereus TaxID=1396 RepID=UPI002FDB5130